MKSFSKQSDYNMKLSIKDMHNVINRNIENFHDVETIYKEHANKQKIKIENTDNITTSVEILFSSMKETYLKGTDIKDFIPWFIQHLKDSIKYLLNSESTHFQKDNNYIYIPFSQTGEESEFQFNRNEIFGILSCCLFGIDLMTKNYSNGSSISFKRIIPDKKGLQKLLCIVSYLFTMCVYPEKEEIVTFSRCILSNTIQWEESKQLLIDVEFGAHGIETSDYPIQVDFSNRNIHLGTISYSATQEEIIFAVKPECYLSIVLFDTMAENECILIKSPLTISKTSGFRNSFRWNSLLTEKEMTKEISILAIDSCTSKCFDEENIKRDLNKCYIGFLSGKGNIASDQWGCGVFGNDPALKIFQQVCVVSELNYHLKLHWMDEKEYIKLHNILKQMIKKKMTIADLYHIIVNYKKNSNSFKFGEYLQNEVIKF